MDFSIFPQCVQNFYSGIQENINEATHCIFEMEKTPGYCEYLLELLYSRPADQIASFASTSLLNFVRKYWHNSDLFLQPKENIYPTFLNILFISNGVVRHILTEAISLIVKADFPEQWPNVFEILSQSIIDHPIEQIELTLAVSNCIFKKIPIYSRKIPIYSSSSGSHPSGFGSTRPGRG